MTNPTIAEIAAKLTAAGKAIICAMKGDDDDFGYMCFAAISVHSGVDRDVLVGSFQHLKDSGLVRFARGLMTEDGEPYGSGYCLTERGLSVRAYLQEQER